MADAKKTKKPAKAPKALKAPKTIDNDVARRIWLAGVGAYGEAYTGLQSAAGKWADQAGAAFDELVAKGEALEDQVRLNLAKDPNSKKVVALVADTAKKSKAFREEQRAALESRIVAVRKTLGESLAPFNVAAIGAAVEKLSAQVESLTHEVAALKAEKKAPARKAPAKAGPAA
jgi:polyhydroxyalkanoate synthesis regulator phasin